MPRSQRTLRIGRIMFHSSTGNIINANSSLKRKKIPISVAAEPSAKKGGASFTLPLSIGHQIQDVPEMIPIKRYAGLQNEYADLVKRYRLMYNEFAEMKIELQRLRHEREDYYLNKRHKP